jgi:hypothetical protein
LIFTSICAATLDSENDTVPNNIADRAGDSLHWSENEFLAAEAMLGSKYGYISSNGNFEGVRSCGGQVKQVARTNFAPSFAYGDSVLASSNCQNALVRAEGFYARPNKKLGLAVAAV